MTLAPCPPGTAARDWSQISTEAGTLSDNVVSVRGTLRLGVRLNLARGCLDEIDPVTRKPLPVTACCLNTYVGMAVVGADGSRVALKPFKCAGDRSRVCCNVAAKGQTVIATGRLVPWPESTDTPWMLAGEVKLCLAEP